MWLSQPDLGLLRSFSTTLFRPRPGHVFLVCQLKHLELRCLARQILQHRPADARIATMFWDNEDPIAQTAMEMREHSAKDDSEHGRQFRQRTPLDDDWWKRTAKVLLAAVPQGLADTQIRTMLDEELWTRAAGEADVGLPSLSFHQGPFRGGSLSRRYDAGHDRSEHRCDRRRRVEGLLPTRPHWHRRSGNSQCSVGRNRGTAGMDTIEIASADRRCDGIIRSRSGGPEASNLLLKWPVAPTGGVGRPDYCTHARGAEYHIARGSSAKNGVVRSGCDRLRGSRCRRRGVRRGTSRERNGSVNEIAEVANKAAERVLKDLARVAADAHSATLGSQRTDE